MTLSPIRPLATLDDLHAALTASADRPVLIFKHSATCGTSAVAEDEVLDLVSDPALPLTVYQVTVQAARPVSNAVTQHFGVRHETPQALLVSQGRLMWHASHYRVTAQEVLAALARLQAPEDGPAQPDAGRLAS